jgi:MraZ protein
VFLGEYQHSLDAKGRVILPAKFRAQLEGGCVLTKGREPCVRVYPREEFIRVSEQLKGIPMSSAQARHAARVFYSAASEQVPDAQGRVLVAENLRRYAGLERDLLIAGANQYFEIWDRDRWLAEIEANQARFSEIADEQHVDLPF